MKALDAVIILAVIAIDDLRNAITGFLASADVSVLVVLLLLVCIARKHQDKITRALSIDFLAAPLKKLKLA
ncbi:MAG: hypothetical protein QW343_01860 [Candidatus Norongarragalinales archaeon]